MRWYVNRNGESVGPVEDAQIVEWIRGGMVEAQLRNEAGAAWFPLHETPFGKLADEKIRENSLQSRAVRWFRANPGALIGLGAAVAIAIILIAALVFRSRRDAAEAEAADARRLAIAQQAEQVDQLEKQAAAKVAAQRQQAAANVAAAQAVKDRAALVAQFSAATPAAREAALRSCVARSCSSDESSPIYAAAKDERERSRLYVVSAATNAQHIAQGGTDGDMSIAATALAVVVEHADPKILDALPKTSGAEARKDPDESRGKVISASGNVLEIRRSDNFFEGALVTDSGNIVRFITPKADGVTDGTWASFRGIFVQEYDYANVSGGETRSILLVGRFQS